MARSSHRHTYTYKFHCQGDFTKFRGRLELAYCRGIAARSRPRHVDTIPHTHTHRES